MSIRSDQKQVLKTALQTISGLTVSDSYINDSNSYPYCYITSGSFRTEFRANRVLQQFRTYNIFLAFSVTQAIAQTQIDDLEGAIIAKLTSQALKDSNQPIFQDLLLTGVSDPFQDDIALKDDLVMKVFTVEAETLPLYI